MRQRVKDRVMDVFWIVFFFAVIGGAGYFIFRVMTSWKVKGLG